MKRFSVLDRALRSVAVQLRSWVVHERVHVYQCGTDFENTTLVYSRSQIDSTLSPKEGKWHQPRRRRLQPKRLQRRRPRRSVLLQRRGPLRRRPRRSVLLRRRPRRSVLLRRRPRRSVLLRRRPRRSVLLRRRPRSVPPRGLPLRSSQFPSGICGSRGASGPPRTPVTLQYHRRVVVEAPGAVGHHGDGAAKSFGFSAV